MNKDNNDLQQIASNLNKVMHELYSKGIYIMMPSEKAHKERLLKIENKLSKEFKKALFKHFGGMTPFMNASLNDVYNSYHTDTNSLPFTDRAAGSIKLQYDSASKRSLKLADHNNNKPFNHNSKNLKSERRAITLFPDSFAGIDTEEARMHRDSISIVTMDIVNNEYHVCFSHVPNTYGQSPMNNIERLSGILRKEILKSAPLNTSIKFYLHIPPERNYNHQEAFMEVKMSEGEHGYKNPRFIHADEIPAGIAKSFTKHYTAPESKSPHGNDNEVLDNYRRNKIRELEKFDVR